MATSSETAHVRWLLTEKTRLDRLIAGAAERRKKIIEDTKRHRKMRTEINKMIALYGEIDVDGEAVEIADINGRIKCPHCASTHTSNARVGDHMRKVHGIFGGLSGQTRPDSVGKNRRMGKAKGKAAA